MVSKHFFSFSFSPKDIFFIAFRGRERDTLMWETNINWLPSVHARLASCSTGQRSNQLSHSIQRSKHFWLYIFISNKSWAISIYIYMCVYVQSIHTFYKGFLYTFKKWNKKSLTTHKDMYHRTIYSGKNLETFSMCKHKEFVNSRFVKWNITKLLKIYLIKVQ